MSGFGWELGRSKLRWAPLLGAAVAAAVHGRDFSTEPDTWLMLAAEAERVATITSPILLLVGAWEAQRHRRARVGAVERTAVRSLASIRMIQAAAIVFWALLTAIVAVGVGMLAASGPHGFRDAVVLTPVPLLGPVVGATLGIALGTILPGAIGLFAALLAAAAMVAGPLVLGPQWWLMFTPLGSSLDASPAVQASLTAARLLLGLAALLALAAIMMLFLQPSGMELIVALLLLALAAGVALAGTLWLLDLAPFTGLPGVPHIPRPLPSTTA